MNKTMEIVHSLLRAKLQTDLKNIKLLVIDEVSMIGYKMWNQIDAAFKFAIPNGKPFGGVNLLFTGDFNQIPPVGDASISFHQDCLVGFTVEELDEGMRQKGDPLFLKALNNFTEGKCDAEDLKLFDELEESHAANWEDLGREVVGMFDRNADVEQLNTKVIQKSFSQNEQYHYRAYFSSTGEVDETSRGPHQVPVDLVVATGCRVILQVNLDVKKGLTNSSVGIVRSCHANYIVIQFNNRSIKLYRWK